MPKSKTPAPAPIIPQSTHDSQYVFQQVRKNYGLLSAGYANGTATSSIQLTEGVTPKELAQVPHLDWIPADMLAFYRLRNGFTIHWQVNPGTEQFIWGRIALEPLHKMVLDREGELYFDDDQRPEAAPMRDFKPVDSCADEWVVGLFYTAARNPELHLFDLEETTRLGVDFSGYLALLTHTLGCQGWQELLLQLSPPTPETRPFQLAEHAHAARRALECLRTAVPGFDLDAFVAHYDRVCLPHQ